MKSIVKLSKIMIWGICLWAVTACSDQFLEDKRDFSRMLPEDVYKDPAQANAVFASIYKRMFERYKHPMMGADALMRQGQGTAGGNVWSVTEEEPKMQESNYLPNNNKPTKSGNFFGNPPYWNDPRSGGTSYNNPGRYTLFPNVYLLNELIMEIELVGRSAYRNDTFWDQLKGQAIFARAWLYFSGVQFFGGVPYYNTETDQVQPGDRSTRMSMQDCFDKICADFETASKLLPAKWDADNEGRFTSVAALAMISRVRIAAASPVFNAGWEDGTARWQAALDASLAAEQAANAAGYGASVTNIDAWDQTFYAYNGIFNPEAIIKVPKSQVNTLSGAAFNDWENRIRPGIVRSTSSAGLVAPEEMLAIFPMENGGPANAANGYDDLKFYRNRDPRFYRTFAFSGCEWPGTTTQLWLFAYKFAEDQDGEYRYTDGRKNDMGRNISRAIVWKMSNPAVPLSSESTAGTDILEYRYGELLLNVAECYAALGNTGECATYLNKLRTRVGAGSAPVPANKYEAIKAVLNERRVELAYEGKRQWDLRRWLLYEGGAGFDPRMVGGSIVDNFYDPEEAYGLGWKLYSGKDGRPEYTKNNNVLTRLGLPRISGTVWQTNKIWMYDLKNIHAVDPYDDDWNATYPLNNDPDLLAVPHIKKDMDPATRNVAFDKLETFYANSGMVTMDGREVPPTNTNRHGMPYSKYGINTGTSNTDMNYLFSPRAWYCLYPIHYDAWDPAKGNDWLTQNEGWITPNYASIEDKTSAQQDGKYIYCTPE